MTPSLHGVLVNGRWGDPALFVDMRFGRRAVLCDLGDLAALEPRRLLRLTDVFVSHAHIDHFIGFDRLLRVALGRDMRLRLYGPAGIADRVEAKLGGYSWNLVERYATDLAIEVHEMAREDICETCRFRLRARFAREAGGTRALEDGVLLADQALTVRAAILDHGIPSLAFALAEPVHVNVWRNRLAGAGLATGPWLRRFKAALAAGEPDGTPIAVGAKDADGRERRMPLGALRQLATVEPGQKIVYATDLAPTEANFARLEALARGADTLYIEATFARADAALAKARQHLTTEMAGRIAAAAGARRVEPFHFSPRYPAADEARLTGEVMAAFAAGRPPRD